MERDTRAKRAKPPPGARTRTSCAHPAPPHPFPRAQEFWDLVRALCRGAPLSPGEGATSLLPGLDDLNPLPARSCFQTAVPLPVAPRALGTPPHPTPVRGPAVLGEDRRGSQGPCPDPAEEQGWRRGWGIGACKVPVPPWSVEAAKGEKEKTCLSAFDPKLRDRPRGQLRSLAGGRGCEGRPGREPAEAGVGGLQAPGRHSGTTFRGRAGLLGRGIRRHAVLSPRPYTLWGSSWGSAVSSACWEQPNDGALGRPAPQPRSRSRAPAEQAELPPGAGACGTREAGLLLLPARGARARPSCPRPPSPSWEPSGSGTSRERDLLKTLKANLKDNQIARAKPSLQFDTLKCHKSCIAVRLLLP